jgi:hypothetical protein
MRHIVLAIVSLAAVAVSASAAPLRQRPLSTSGRVGDGVIIGRAHCGASTWLLSAAPALVEVRVVDRTIVTTQVRGFTTDEHPWGLACVGAGELWTLAGYRTLARLSASGDVTSRTKLRQPRLNVFGAGDRLLFQQQPGAAGTPLLAVARVADVNRAESWPGPLALPQSSTKIDVPSGLVACGLAYDALLPCWIANQTRITVSDGVRARTSIVQPQFVASTAVDRAVPLWDVAVARSSALWILTSAASEEGGRRGGGRLTRSNLRGDDLGSVDLTPRARFILSASEQLVVVLTMGGTLLEVTAP